MKREIKYIGQINRDGINELYSNSRAGMLIFMPKKNHMEAQPNKMFEYMAAGLPFIASKFPYWKDSLEKEKCCIFVNPESAEEIAEAANFLLDNPKTAQKYGENGRKLVVEKFNWDLESKNLLNLYKDILN